MRRRHEPARATSSSCAASRPDARSGALQRSIADRAPHAGLIGDRAADAALIRSRLESAIGFRATLAIDASAYRLVHGEADLLPSLVVDRYGDYLALQTLSVGWIKPDTDDRHGPQRLSAAQRDTGEKRPARLLEGLEQRVDLLSGDVPEAIAVRESGGIRRGRSTVHRASLKTGSLCGLQACNFGHFLACSGLAAVREACYCPDLVTLPGERDAQNHRPLTGTPPSGRESATYRQLSA